jgi:hypothetical protein
MLSPDPSRAYDRRLKLLPRCTKFSTAAAVPIRQNDLKLKELPKFTKSTPLIDEPKRLRPISASELPSRATLRSDKQLPSWK